MYKDTLSNNLHKIVRLDPLVNEINGSVGLTLDNFDERMTDFANQIDISKATWGLPIYEKELQIVTDIAKPLDERRSNIISKLRVTGKTGAAEIKIVADSWSNGAVDVRLENGVTIQFNGALGLPSNVVDLKNVVRSIVPAHLKINYEFRFLLISEIVPKTIAQMSILTLSNFAGGS